MEVFSEQVTPQLFEPMSPLMKVKTRSMSVGKKKNILWLSAMPRTQPSSQSDIDRYERNGDGFFIINDHKQDVGILLLLLLMSSH